MPFLRKGKFWEAVDAAIGAHAGADPPMTAEAIGSARPDHNSTTCFNCQGALVPGEPQHELNSNGVVQHWCRDCIHYYSWMLWPDEWGPYPHGPPRKQRAMLDS